MGVATLVRSAAKPLAMVGVTGLLSLGMVAMASEQAQALAVPPVAPIIEGATAALLPEVMGAEAAIGPAGWILLGVTGLAYVTKDYWIPIVTGAVMGQPTDNSVGQAPQSNPYVDPRVQLAPNGVSLGANPWTLNVAGFVDTSGLPSGINHGFHVAYHLHCTSNKDGTGDVTDRTGDGTSSYNSATQPGFSMNFACQYGYVQGGTFGPYMGAPELNYIDQGAGGGPKNIEHWGSSVQKNSDGFDPHSNKVTYHTTVECISPDGKKASITADSTGDIGAVKVPSCEAAGLGRETGKIDITNDNPQTTGQPTWHKSAPGADPNHPLCDPTLPGPLCKLQILIDGKPCVEGQVECVRWAQLAKTDPSRVQCFYGPYQVALANCNMLERGYEIGGAPANIPNTDGDPTTRSDAGPTGQPQPGAQPGAQPDPNIPRTTPGTVAPPVPGTGGQPQPGDTPESKDCFPTGWGMLNPVEWVFKPTQCALKWAFVPDTSTMTGLQTKVQSDIDHVGFGPLQASVVGMFAPLGNGGSGCQGPPITFAMDGQSQTIYPFNACTSPMSIAAGICNALFTLAFTVGGGLALLRAISSAFGYNFSFGRSSGGADA